MTYNESQELSEQLSNAFIDNLNSYKLNFEIKQDYIKYLEKFESDVNDRIHEGLTFEFNNRIMHYTFYLEDELEMKSILDRKIENLRYSELSIEELQIVYNRLYDNKLKALQYLQVIKQMPFQKVYVGYSNKNINSQIATGTSAINTN